MRTFLKSAAIIVVVLATFGFLAFLYYIPPFLTTAPETFGKLMADAAPAVTDIADPGERAALSDAEAHGRILKTLYQRRRESARDPGVGYYHIQQMLGCSDENLEFHVWYLKQKGLVETTEQGALAITIAGVDHVIGESRTAAREKLRITQGSGQPGVDGRN